LFLLVCFKFKIFIFVRVFSVFILKYIIIDFYSVYMYFIVSHKSDFGWILID
jgi:hypothetical protein